ncbi:MAG: rimI, partial [Paucimonas sp.]|nr:rimI [Paucimonas sp.]
MSSTTSIKAYDAMLQLAFARMQPEDLPEVRRIEEEVYPFPWTAGNFADSLANGYRTRVARDATGTIVGYFLILLAVDEAHLLNITVRRNLQARGIGRMMLGEAAKIAREEGMRSMLLEVRPSNLRALAI